MTTLIILVLVFVFVALRLWSVLGRRTGHEQPIAKPSERVLTPRTAPSASGNADAPVTISQDAALASPAGAGLRAIAAADPQFDATRFIEGARSAYRMILEAYWRGDEAALGKMVDGEVAQAFGHAIAERTRTGEVLDNRLITIESAQIEDARVEGQTAFVRVHFEADVSAVTRDRDGQVVAGSLTDAVPTHDIWTFSRPLRSADPNWTLTETDEAS